MTSFLMLNDVLKGHCGIEVPINAVMHKGLGRSLEEAYIIESDDSPESKDYTTIEYLVINCLCKIQNTEWQLIRQSLHRQSDRKIDAMQIEITFLDEHTQTLKKKTETHYFDITSCLAQPSSNNIKAPTQTRTTSAQKHQSQRQSNSAPTQPQSGSLDTYDVYVYPMRAERAYLRDSPLYRLKKFLNNNPRMKHIATCQASSKKEAIKKAIDTQTATPPEPLGSLGHYFFGLRERKAASTLSNIMSIRRDLFAQAVKNDIISKKSQLAPSQERELTIFSYLVEWMALLMTKMSKREVQLVVMHFSRETSEDSVSSEGRLETKVSAAALQDAITMFRLNLSYTNNFPDVADYLASRLVREAGLEEILDAKEVSSLVSKTLNELRVNSQLNQKFTEKYKISQS